MTRGERLTAIALILLVCVSVGVAMSIKQAFDRISREPQPTPAAIDYTPQLTAIGESLQKLAAKEHSVIVPKPTPDPRINLIEQQLADLKKRCERCHK